MFHIPDKAVHTGFIDVTLGLQLSAVREQDGGVELSDSGLAVPDVLYAIALTDHAFHLGTPSGNIFHSVSPHIT